MASQRPLAAWQRHLPIGDPDPPLGPCPAPQELPDEPVRIPAFCKRDHTLLATGADPAPSKLDQGGAEQVLARRDRVTPRDVARGINRLEPDEPILCVRVHAALHESAWAHPSNGNFESVEGD